MSGERDYTKLTYIGLAKISYEDTLPAPLLLFQKRDPNYLLSVPGELVRVPLREFYRNFCDVGDWVRVMGDSFRSADFDPAEFGRLRKQHNAMKLIAEQIIKECVARKKRD